MKSLVMIGYQGPGSEHVATVNDEWSAIGSKTSDLYQDIQNLDNYDPDAIWNQFKGSDIIISDYDTDNLRQNLPDGKAGLEEGENPNLWLPALLYNYGVRGKEQVIQVRS